MARSSREKPAKKTRSVSSVLGVPSKELLEYIRFFQKNKLAELTIKERGTTVSLKKDAPAALMPRPAPVVPAVPAQEGSPSVPEEAAEPETAEGASIKSPITGTYYDSPSPGAPAFVKEGQVVEKGQPVCIVEAMKVMNKITADHSCRIIKKKAKDAKPVKSGDALFLIEPS